MIDRTVIDSSTLAPLRAPGPEAPSRSDAEAASGAKPTPARKARRPRPTFDDGALTRTFKFPSKAYPRSSYYVTSTEIIIRIKKARKKWKLSVPKKRVVSYRTNRWFAKPRWVAIELTYTQAVKLGLAEARARVPDAMPESVGSEHAAPAPSDIDISCADATSASPRHLEAPDASDAADLQTDLTDQIDVLGEQDNADDFQLAADQDEFGAEETLPQPIPHASSPEATTGLHTAMHTNEDVPRVVPFVAQRQQPVVAPRRTFRRAITTLAAAITGFAIWAAFDTTPLRPRPDCAGGEPAAHCANPIVTGSIGAESTPQLTAAIEDPPLTAAQAADVARAELAAQNTSSTPLPAAADEKPDTALPATPMQDVGTIVLSGRDIALPLSPPVFTSAVSTLPPTAAATCEGLSAAGRRILINFDYGQSRLDTAALAVIEDFAAKLQACPASKVSIEGHTDSDGRADRNRSLSLRRAQAVQKHLVAAGVDPDRLAAIGFGQTRPAVPNVSQQNKRNNRRAALVVTSPR